MHFEPFALRGQVVRLEPLERHHADALLEAAGADRSTFGYTLVPHERTAMEAYIGGLLADSEAGRAMPFVHCRPDGDGDGDGGGPKVTVIGCTRFMNITWWPSRTTPAEVEIGGTWLRADAQRSGVNTEAKLLMLTHAFDLWQVDRVAVCTDARNEQSRRAIERLGAALEGVLRNHRPAAGEQSAAGASRDSAMYSIIPSEWPDIRDRLQRSLVRDG